MRRMLIILIWVCALPAVYAAQPLNILKILNGTYRNANYATETIVTGEAAKPYNLSLYHSLTVTDSAAMSDLQRVVQADMLQAVSQEVEMRKGRINYGLFEFAPVEKRKNRFVFFFSDDRKAVLMYMEGNTSIDEIKCIIKR